MADESPPRNIRIDKETWDGLGGFFGERKRAPWFADLAAAMYRAPQAWKEFRAIADARGEDFPDAINRAVKLYRDAE